MSVIRSSLRPDWRQDGQMGRPHGDLRRHVKSVEALIAKAAAVKVQIAFRRVDLMCVTSARQRTETFVKEIFTHSKSSNRQRSTEVNQPCLFSSLPPHFPHPSYAEPGMDRTAFSAGGGRQMSHEPQSAIGPVFRRAGDILHPPPHPPTG